MEKRKSLYKYISKELDEMPIQFLVTQAKIALEAYRQYEDYEHLVELYFAVVSLMLKVTDFDPDIIDEIEKDIELFFPHLN